MHVTHVVKKEEKKEYMNIEKHPPQLEIQAHTLAIGQQLPQWEK